MKFKEYLQLNADDSIEQVMDGEWILKSRTTWKATDDEDNKLEIHNDGHDPELKENRGRCIQTLLHQKPLPFFVNSL